MTTESRVGPLQWNTIIIGWVGVIIVAAPLLIGATWAARGAIDDLSGRIVALETARIADMALEETFRRDTLTQLREVNSNLEQVRMLLARHFPKESLDSGDGR